MKSSLPQVESCYSWMQNLLLSSLVLAGLVSCDPAHGQTVKGLSLADGFVATKVASNEIASNIYSLSVSPDGRTFVTGPGYIKTLVDSDGDGIFDSAKLFSDRPKSGAQGGLEFDGDEIYCTGDGAVLKFADADKDGVADGPPAELLKIKTGGEHDAHSVRRGPGGWWYVLAGNGVPILPEYFAGPDSPVKQPRAGFLMRCSPDWSVKEIFCHGFRNAYDFDFNSLGEVFVYDSDGERDVNLPWYRPTRIYRMRAGDDAGWVGRSWKRPSYFPDMPIEVGALGRGSPTGVVVCNSQQFPASFRDAVFVADWTFGRVVAFRKTEIGRYDRGTDFAIATGQFGFAVSDIDFAADGSLLISVGGRGTEGAVYRITYTGDEKSSTASELSEAQKFIRATKTKEYSFDDLLAGLSHPKMDCRLAAMEALVGHRELFEGGNSKRHSLLRDALLRTVPSLEPRDVFLFLRVIQNLNRDELAKYGDEGQRDLVNYISLFASYPEETSLSKAGVAGCLKLVEQVGQMDRERDALAFVRLAQLWAGSCGRAKSTQMFLGYSPKRLIGFDESERARAIESLEAAFREATKVRHESLAVEIGRLAAMLKLGSTELYDKMSQRLTSSALVPEDIHWLNCLARCGRGSFDNDSVRTRIASSLTGLNEKLKRQNLTPDRNFYPRLGELVKLLFSRDEKIARLVAKEIQGRPDDAFLFRALPSALKQEASQAFLEAAKANRDQIDAQQLEIIAGIGDEESSNFIRSLSDRPELRSALTGIVSRSPLPEDRELFFKGLLDPSLTTMKNSAVGLRRLFKVSTEDELLRVIQAIRKLGWDKASVSVRDQLMMLVEKHTENTFGYQQKKPKLRQTKSVQSLEAWFAERNPELFKKLQEGTGSHTSLIERLSKVDWTKGASERGRVVYKKLRCAQCHDGGTRLGPQLAGVSKRFGRDDLFLAIANPNDQVPERYRAFVIESVDGLIYRGSKIYDSVDGITLQQTDGRTVRLNQSDIESRSMSSQSLMPEGLLNEASGKELADLYAFLKEL